MDSQRPKRVTPTPRAFLAGLDRPMNPEQTRSLHGRYRTVERTTREQIRALRLEQGVSQEELARRTQRIGADLTELAISRTENGRRQLYVRDLWAIAAVLRTPLQDVVNVPIETRSTDEQLEEARAELERLRDEADAAQAAVDRQKALVDRYTEHLDQEYADEQTTEEDQA